ncbi:MAG: aspartyl protease family protein [Pyrinomonadaceae bacterium]
MATILFAQGIHSIKKNENIAEVEFPTGKTSLQIPFNNDLGLVFFKLRINGSTPVWFNLDTGYDVSIIDAGLAKKLKLKVNNPKVIDVPGGSVETGDISGVNVNIDGLIVKNQPMQTTPLAALGGFVGHDFGGILGHDFINLFAIEIDYDKDLITFHNPESFQYDGKGESIPVEIIEGEPFLYLNILPEGRTPIKAKLKIDTGSISGLGFNKNFIEANDMPDKKQKVLDVTGLAVGGDTKNIVFKLKGFQIGSYLMKDLFAGATIDSGGFENRNDAGTFGGEILTHFSIVLDYSRKRIIFEPNSMFSKPFELDKSGLFFITEGSNYKTFKIYSLVGNSPAEKAGLKIGDKIVSINNLTPKQLSLDKLWTMMRTKEGTLYQVKIKRGKKLIHINLKLQSML